MRIGYTYSMELGGRTKCLGLCSLLECWSASLNNLPLKIYLTDADVV